MNKGTNDLSTLTRKEVLDLLNRSRNLSNLDIRKANPIKIDFTDCDLRNSNFSYSNLKDSIFKNADMRNTSLWNANLENVDFTGADMEGSDLDYSKLRGATFFEANLRRANLPTDLVSREEIMFSVKSGVMIGGKKSAKI